MSDDPLTECEKCGGSLRKVLHPVAIHFKGSGFYTTDYGKGSGRRAGAKESGSDAGASDRRRGLVRRRRLRQDREEGLGRGQVQGDAEGDLTQRGGEPRGATDRRGPAQGADHPAGAGQRRPVTAAVPQSRRRLDPAGAREIGSGRPPVRQPGPVRPPRAGVRLAHRLRDPRRGGGQSRGHGRQHAAPAGRRQRLHAHRRRVHRPALPAAVRGRDRRGRPRGGDAARLRAAAVPAAQRPRAGRVRPRAPFRRLRRARGRRQPHVRADPAARPRAGHAGGGRAGRALRSRTSRRRWPIASRGGTSSRCSSRWWTPPRAR